MPPINRLALPAPIIFMTLAVTIGVAMPAAADNPIRIGATMSESGAYSTQGTAARNGYRLCESHINEAGGLLDRPVEFVIHDDESDTERAIKLYERLISEEQVDAIMGPYGSTLTEAVAPVTERHQMVHISPLAATTSIWEQGREYLFMVLPPAELFLAGLIDMADERGLERVAVINEDELFPAAAAQGAADMALERGMTLAFHEPYETGTEDFGSLVERLDEDDVQVLAMAASPLDDFIEMTRQMKSSDVSVTMFGTSGAVEEYREALGGDADYTYGLSAWEPSLPNPGIEEFTQAYQETFERAPSFHAAGGYGSCQLFVEAAEKAGSLDADAMREALLELETTTVFGPFKVDERGYQTANQGVFIQWQDGDREVVWPEESATGEARFPTPAWKDR